ncbi:sugar ABC transporter ATP-binding protein [Sinorhizobium numidicum]|uniref:Sugar ABC transporter ATP-binding protein n=1 Tax=Sinorhizobium numidicum TaxID=680248 RepID=A0ABY8CS19_9HYPH|nr:sugar ABC transporter ATP-binding protein [Sinorhizobium numidicum]WEX74705.1 sugar ABC transporter ATP-binding protein [Sinorhizobium numidicum]WEX80697.1 sugar ABC transporter ATP-binding protein [Sinorhizobium numidicum]
MAEPLLRLSGISRSFGMTRALQGVHFELLAGEIHALLGENGAGKSTLLGVLSGVVAPDSGSIEIDARQVTIDTPAKAQALGIGTVFQELSLARALTVAENVFAGRAPTHFGLVRWRELRRRTRDILAEFDVEADVDRPVGRLPVGMRQLVEIAKALSLSSRILLLDEPTSALDAVEVEALFQVLRRLKERGIGIVYVTHRIPEVFRIADRITVLRDGRLVSTNHTDAISPDLVVQDMVGRHFAALTAPSAQAGGGVALKARNLGRRGEFSGVDLTLRFGEVVGLAGLMGARRDELARTLAGIVPVHCGTIEVRGDPVRFHDARHAMRLGVAYVPADRKEEGLFVTKSVVDNIIVTALGRFSRNGLLNAAAGREATKKAVERFHIRVPGLCAAAAKLSGGNQQKLMIAKWLERRPEIIIIDEPTRGVDIGAKQDIHQEIRRLASQGKAVLFVSSDLPELFALTNRIIVMQQGRIAAELETASATEELVMAFAAGTRGHKSGAVA